MEKHKLTKQELKSPDAFISHMAQIGEWAFENRMIIITAFIVVAVGVAVWASIGMFRAHKEDLAQESLFKAEKTLQDIDESFLPVKEDKPVDPKAAAKTAKDEKPSAPKAVATGQLDVDYKTALPLLKDVISSYPSTQASVVAALDLGRLYHDYKKYDDEISVLTEAVPEADHPVTKAMLLDNLGIAFEVKGDCNKALEQWQKISDHPKMSAFYGKAIINSALCYEKLNQPDKALAYYEKFDNAEKELTTLTNSLAAEYSVNPNLPLEQQPAVAVQKYQNALYKSARYQELGHLLGDQDSVKTAKKYMKLLKRGQS